MWSLFGQIALEYLYNKYKDPNRDKPPAPIQPVVIQPHTTSSLSAGKNVADSVDVLRLDPSGQTPHQPDIDEMTVDFVKRQFGLVAQLEWKSSDTDGTQITAFVLPASPCMAPTAYGKTEFDGVDCFHLPPVAVISNLYGQWRGSIEYRLDFVCTRYHVGKLWVSFQPNVEKPMTYLQSRACAGIEIDLSEDRRQHTFSVPYLSDRPFWPRCYSSGVDADSQRAPGIVVGYVLAPLTCTDVIASKIGLNIYVRGGEDLEFAVPCQPGIGLAYNPRRTKDIPEHAARPYIAGKNYAPNYVGTWHDVAAGTKAVMRWGTASDEVAQYSGLKEGYIYTLSPAYKTKWSKQWMTNVNGTMVSATTLFFVPITYSTDGYIYLGVCQTENQAKLYWATQDDKGAWAYRYKDQVKKKGKLKPSFDALLDAGTTSDNQWSPNLPGGGADIYILEGSPAIGTAPVSLSLESEDSYDPLEDFPLVGHGDGRTSAGVSISLQEGQTIGGSEAMYGEKFYDLKDLCRRYQPYWKASFTPPKEFGSVSATIPAVPTGLALDENDPFQSFCRDGIIPIIASGYRFYRGGLRFKILTSWLAPGSVWLQVRPDRRFRGRSPFTNKSSQMDAMFNHGYATSFQSTSVNPTMTVEIPYYQPGEYGLLQMTDDATIARDQVSWNISNGEIALGCVSHPMTDKPGVQITFIVVYSLADDCRFSVFQGFPPVIPVKDKE